MNKVCWIDVETTGLDAVKQDVIQIAGIVEIDGDVVDDFEFKCQPISWDEIQPKALEVHGYSIEDLQQFPKASDIQYEVAIKLGEHVNKYDKKDKFVFAGYNSPFDYRFVSEWFKKCGDNYFNSFFYHMSGYHAQLIDTYQDFIKYARAIQADLPNHKLVTAAAHFGMEFDAHDALADISVTRDIDIILRKMWVLGANQYWAERANETA